MSSTQNMHMEGTAPPMKPPKPPMKPPKPASLGYRSRSISPTPSPSPSLSLPLSESSSKTIFKSRSVTLPSSSGSTLLPPTNIPPPSAPTKPATRGGVVEFQAYPPTKALTKVSLMPQNDEAESTEKDGVDAVLLAGQLSKMNREGKYEKSQFVLTEAFLSYYKLSQYEKKTGGGASLTFDVAESVESSKFQRSIPVESILVMDLDEDDHHDGKSHRAFKLLSAQKSFLLRAKTVDLKQEWLGAIDKAARAARAKTAAAGGGEGSGARDKDPTAASMAPVWKVVVSACQICNKAFSFLTRKHHCRNCGRCVCETCSKEKIRVPKIDARKLYKVCAPCALELKETRQYGAVES